MIMEVDNSSSSPNTSSPLPIPLSNFSAVSVRNGSHSSLMRKNGTTAKKLNIKNAKGNLFIVCHYFLISKTCHKRSQLDHSWFFYAKFG